MGNNYIFFKNKVVPLDEARTGVLTHALHYSTSCFEGIRGNWNESSGTMHVFRLLEHYERLHRSADVFMIELGHTPEELCGITVDLLQQCGYREDVYIRPMAYKSSERIATLNLRDLESSLVIAVMPFGNYLEPSKPLRCITSSWRKPADVAVPSNTKIAGIYTTNILAKTDAVSKGFDEAILLAANGNVSEGSGENLFMVKDGVMHTPPIGDNCLMGITRSSVIQLAREGYGMEVRERSIQRSELYAADEVFLCGTAAHITPVGELDNRAIGDGRAGDITTKLQSTYFDVIRGVDEKYHHWSTAVKI